MNRLNSQTPSAVSAAITDSIAYLVSPLLLGASLTTRYVLPTLTVKTGSITFKRTEYMKKWGEGGPTDSTSRIDHDLILTCSPAAQTLIQVLPYITTEEAIISIVWIRTPLPTVR